MRRPGRVDVSVKWRFISSIGTTWEYRHLRRPSQSRAQEGSLKRSNDVLTELTEGLSYANSCVGLAFTGRVAVIAVV